MSTTKNPIIVRKNGKKARLQELKYEVGRDFQRLEVYSDQGDLLIKQDVTEYPYLSLDSELGVVKLVYRTIDGDYVGDEVISLEVEDDDKKYYTEEELAYLQLQQAVIEEMENPLGSEKEKAEHTRLLKDSATHDYAKQYVMSRIRRILIAKETVPAKDIDRLAYRLYADLYGLGAIQELDDDPDVGEIMVNARVFPYFHADIYYYKNGQKQTHYYTFQNLEQLKNVFDRVIAFNKKAINSVETAIVEAIRPNRDRVNIVVPDASENYILNIRKFTNFVPNLQMMKKAGTVDHFIDRLMDVVVRGKANIGIGGPMNSGKTTFVNFLLTYTPKLERKVIVANVAEVDAERVLSGHDVLVLNVDEEKGFTFDKQVRTSLRTTADRVIVPESRGGEFKQIYEVNLKTRGNIFTAHALDDEDFLEMCVDMYMSSPDVVKENQIAIRNKVAKSINIVIIMRNIGGKIRIKSISEILTNDKGEYEGMNRLVEWEFNPEDPTKGRYVRTQNRLSSTLKKRLNEFGVPMSEMADL